MSIQLLSVNTAGVSKLLIDGQLHASAIRKRSTPAVVTVGPLGLAGDDQADPRYHGGVNKAVYAYPHEHYAWWQQQRAQHGLPDSPLPYGFMGENLTLTGLLETELYVGDFLHFPDCTLRVTEPREPCFKFTHVMGYARAAKDMLQTGFSGSYFAVSRAGNVQAGQTAHVEAGSRQTPLLSLLPGKR